MLKWAYPLIVYFESFADERLGGALLSVLFYSCANLTTSLHWYRPNLAVIVIVTNRPMTLHMT